MRRFSAADHARITAAIHKAELRTRGEFVAVVAHQADHDVFVVLLWSAVIALFIPDGLWLLSPHWSGAHWMEAQLAVFVGVALPLLLVPGLGMRLIPRHIRHLRARRLARSQFYEQGVHTTPDHSGVLFFVALAERYVEIVADAGIHDHVGDQRWQEIIHAFLGPVGQGAVIDGLIAGIEACGLAMEQHYPPDPSAHPVLSDGLIEL